jgi:RimJ/RimL family protein N-acetyltransferase
VCLIIETLEAEVIGLVSFGEYKADSRSAELSLLIGEADWWERGIGTDVLQTVIATCFDDWNLRRLWARAEAFNERAHRLFRRCGFVHEATLREASYFDGHYHDLLVFGLLITDEAGSD